MRYNDVLEFLQPDELQKRVKGIFEKEHDHIAKLFPDVDIQNVGSSAISGAIGKFDVDIQLRVSQLDFPFLVGFMRSYAEPRNTKIWTPQYALFNNKEEYIDYNVTVIDSNKDFYYKMRDYFIANPLALKEYGALKMKYQGKIYEEYREPRYVYLKEIKSLLLN
jgi:GrpB-like predicted nucleotidyltransferase (UPF0157 family)